MNFMTFHILGIIIQTDFHIFQRGRYTTNQIVLHHLHRHLGCKLPGIDLENPPKKNRSFSRGNHWLPISANVLEGIISA